MGLSRTSTLRLQAVLQYIRKVTAPSGTVSMVLAKLLTVTGEVTGVAVKSSVRNSSHKT